MMDDALGLTVHSNSYTDKKAGLDQTGNSFAKSMQKGPPVVPPSKIPTVTVSSNAFSVGEHQKQQNNGSLKKEGDLFGSDAHKKRIRFGSSEAKKNRAIEGSPADSMENTAGKSAGFAINLVTGNKKAIYNRNDSPVSPSGIQNITTGNLNTAMNLDPARQETE